MMSSDRVAGDLGGKPFCFGANSIADALADTTYRDVYVEIARELMALAAARGITREGFKWLRPAGIGADPDRAVADRSLDDMVAFNQKSAKTNSGIWRDIGA